MSSPSDKKANEYLQVPGYSDSPDTVYVERAPLSYFPGNSTELNRARLPKHADLFGMELAYRQEASSSTTAGMARINFIVLWSILVPIALVALPQFFTYQQLNIVGPVLSGIFILMNLIQGRLNLNRILPILILPSLAIAAAYWLGVFIQVRLLALFFLGIWSIMFIFILARAPFDFYSQWAHTHPRLKPETRHSADRIKAHPNYLVVLLVFAAAFVIPFFSNSLAIVVVLGLVILFAAPGLTKRHFRQMKKVLSVFATYRPAYQVPGVWLPKVPKLPKFLMVRFPGTDIWKPRPKTMLVMMVFTVALTLSVALYLYSFWDLPKVGLPSLMAEVAQQQNYQVPKSYFLEQFRESPAAWIGGALETALGGSIAMVWVFPLALALAFVIPALFFMGMYRGLLNETMAIDKRIEGYNRKDGTYVAGVDEDGRTEWQWYLDRIHCSAHTATDPLLNNVREAEHLFLGLEPHADIPVFLHDTILNEHCYMVGETGSGKTALGVIPILSQLIRGHRKTTSNGDTQTTVSDPATEALSQDDPHTSCPPIVILDLKGDPALFNAVRAEAQGWANRTGRDIEDVFQFFTPEPKKATYRFNPLADFLAGERSLPQLTQLLLDSLALSHGEGYGRSYYTRRNRQLLNAALMEAKLKNQLPKDITELYKLVENLAKTKGSEFKDAFELISTLHSLSQYDAIAHDPALKRFTIHMPTVLEQRQISYFWLPAAIESASVRELGKMAIYALLSAAIDRQRTGKPYRQAYLVIDEFQRLAGENFKVILEQSRSFGIANILANQTQGDLKTSDTDLRPTIRTNTRAKFYFSLSDPDEVLALSQSSGEEIALMRSDSYMNSLFGGSMSTTTTTLAQSLKPRLIRNDVLRVSDHPLEFMLQVSRGSGYTQFGGVPIPVRTTYPHHKHQYNSFMQEPWPTLTPELTQESKTPVEKEQKADELKTEWNLRFEKDFSNLQNE